MTQAVADILRQAAALTAEERAEVAFSLLDLPDEPEDEGAAEAWNAELERRRVRILSGEATGRPAFEVLEEIRRRWA